MLLPVVRGSGVFAGLRLAGRFACSLPDTRPADAEFGGGWSFHQATPMHYCIDFTVSAPRKSALRAQEQAEVSSGSARSSCCDGGGVHGRPGTHHDLGPGADPTPQPRRLALLAASAPALSPPIPVTAPRASAARVPAVRARTPPSHSLVCAPRRRATATSAPRWPPTSSSTLWTMPCGAAVTSSSRT